MRIYLVLFFLFQIAFSADLEITSKHFSYDQSKKQSVFKDDVNITREKDSIQCNELTVHFNEDKKPTEFIAVGDVHFQVALDANNTYKGTSKKVVYGVIDQTFLFEGNVSIEKIEDKQVLYGETVEIDKKKGKARVVGEERPIKFIIEVDE